MDLGWVRMMSCDGFGAGQNVSCDGLGMGQEDVM